MAPRLAVGLAVLIAGCGWEDGEPGPSRSASPSAPATAEAPSVVERPALSSGAAFTVELSGGSEHLYPVLLAAGDYLHAAVEQRGTDVVLEILGPGGQCLLSVDSPTGRRGSEHAFFVAAEPGRHRLRLRAWDKAEPGAGYRLRVAALRPASGEDRLRAAAAAADFQASELARHPGEPGATAEAFGEAARLWAEVGESSRQAAALYQLGKLHSRGSRPDLAADALSRALALYLELDDRRHQALVLYYLGRAWRQQGDLDGAARCYRQSLELWRELEQPEEEAARANDLAVVRRLQGRIHQSIELFQYSLELWRRLGARRRQATTQTNLGIVYAQVGDYSTALDLYRQALALLEVEEDRQQQAVTLNKLGDARLWLGEPQAALQAYNQALTLRRQEHDPRGEAVTLNSIALAHVEADRPRQALAAYRRALEIFQQRGEKAAEAMVRCNLAHAYERLGHRRRAQEDYSSALALARQEGYAQAASTALLGLARLSRQQGRLEAAEELAWRSLVLVESIRQQARRPDLRAAFLATRQDHYEFLIDLLARRHRLHPGDDHAAEAFAISERSRARSLLDALSTAAGPHDRSPSRTQRLNELGARINARHLDLLAPSAVEADPARAHRERELLQLLQSFQQTAASPELERGADAGAQPILSLAEAQAGQLDADTLLLEYHLGQERSFLWAVTASSSRFIDDLPAGEDIEQTARRAYGLLRKSHFQTDELAARQAAARLSRLLLEPVADLLHHRRLVIVAPGALQYIPFAALPQPLGAERPPGIEPPPLLADHEVVHLPSVSVLATLRRELADRPSPPGLLALIADPVLEEDDERLAAAVSPAARAPDTAARWPALPALERLEYARREADTLLGLAGDAPVLAALGFAANRQLVVESGRLSDYRIVHFATHGLFDTARPELSAIALSRFDEQGRPRDGLLRAYEVYQMHLPADLVVLSACRTALGAEIRGEGLVGLTRSFLHAGAGRVLVSLWNVSDQATSELMRVFYSGLLDGGVGPAEALRQAQLAIRTQERWRAPYYWAGFVLYGEWR